MMKVVQCELRIGARRVSLTNLVGVGVVACLADDCPAHEGDESGGDVGESPCLPADWHWKMCTGTRGSHREGEQSLGFVWG
jgi:hypothetical protein